MKSAKFFLSSIVLLVMVLVFSSGNSNAQTWDITNDWSNTANPNGVWTYRHGSTALPWVSNMAVAGFNQGAWAGSGSVGTFLPFWAQLQASTSSYDLQIGDVFMHSTDAANGRGHGVGNAIWTSPIDGVVSIDGSAWMARDIGRSNHWSLLVNGGTITGGNVYSGDSYSRANPFYFSNGSGGASVLENISVSSGDVIELRVATNVWGSGDFVGVDFNVSVVPEPVSSTLFIIGGATLGFRLWRKKRAI